MTNCPNCGAPLTGHKCQYCGAIIFDFDAIEVEKPVWINFKLGEHWVLAHVLPESASVHVEPKEALKRLKELSEDLRLGWVDIYGPEGGSDELVIEALDVAIACLEEKCHE